MGKVFFSFLFCLLGSLAIPAMPAAAMTLSKSGQITISGIVPPAKRIIVDDTGKIQKIISNCNIDAPLYAYMTQDMTIQTNLTDNIVRQYDLIKSSHNLNRIGTVYASDSGSPAPNAVKVVQKTKPRQLQLSNLYLGNLFQKI